VSNITILIPTFRRPGKLARALEYYSSTGIPVLVADGSESAFEGAVPANVYYHHEPAVDYAERISSLLGNVRTEHIILAADDDFIVPDFILRADSLLSRRPDCSAVFGQCCSFGENASDWRRIYGWAKAVEQDTVSARLQAFFARYYPLYYAPTHTQLVRDIFLAFAGWPVRVGNVIELMFAARLIIAGKVAVLDEPYTARELPVETPRGVPFQGVPQLLAEDDTLKKAMSALADQWLGTSDSGVFEREILRPYRDLFLPWYEGKGVMRRAAAHLSRLLRASAGPPRVQETEAVRQIRRAVERHAVDDCMVSHTRAV
jgi:glycosyltransferase domain-containing protein